MLTPSQNAFQFHSGLIKRDIQTPAPLHYDGFNSILVWLKAGRGTDVQAGDASFQFHSGLIKSPKTAFYRRLIKEFQFHSGLIKRFYGSGLLRYVNMFQFHSGLIKSNMAYTAIRNVMVFQFHSGLIKSLLRLRSYLRKHLCFNSILVWLKEIQMAMK